MISPSIQKIESYLRAIRALPTGRDYTKEDLIREQFMMEKQGSLSIYYAPHNELINTMARIVIVGITPGWSQMKTAFEAASQSFGTGGSLEEVLQQAKRSAGFAGSMRRHLNQMLNEIDVPDAFGLESAEDLFDYRSDLLHTTSIIKYPVFNNEKNYTGYAPKMNHVEMLSRYVNEIFPEELSLIKGNYLLVPLGKAVSDTLQELAVNNKIPNQCCLFGFPHPSGANGHRVKQFAEEKERLKKIVKGYKP